MPIEFVKGLPRGGKTFYVMGRIFDEICEEFPRIVVSNMVLRHHHLADLVAQRLNISRERAIMRVKSLCYYLPQDELKEFYRRRGFGHFFRKKDDIHIEGTVVTFPAYDSHFDEWSVFYVLDEIHVPYPISAHKDDLEAVSYYLSQHGKIGGEPFDHVIVISQHPDQVAKKFKMLVQKWHSVRNRHMDKIGMFKMGSYFVRKEYMTEPKLGTSAIDSQSFPFRKDLADCYDTLAGVGMRGRGIPRIAHAKGLPRWTLWALGFGAVALLFAGVAVIPQFIGQAFQKKLPERAPVLGQLSPSKSTTRLAPSVGSPSSPGHPWPIYVHRPTRSVCFSDGSFEPLAKLPASVGRLVAIVDGYRVPVVYGPIDAYPLPADKKTP